MRAVCKNLSHYFIDPPLLPCALLPARVFPSFPQLLRHNKLSCEVLAMLMPPLTRFLVGPATTEAWSRSNFPDHTPFSDAAECDDQAVLPRRGDTWKSKVVIERCRFLEESKCKGMCVELCQKPTQEFFTAELVSP